MGGKIKSAFWGMWYGARAAFAFANGTVRRVGLARYAALVVITLALFLYLTPYVVDALQCVRSAEQPAAQREDGTDLSFRQCLGETYDMARQDTNLAAIIIALAVILAALRPGQDTTP